VIVIKADFETSEIGLMLLRYGSDHFFRCDTQLLCFQHNRGAMRIVSTDKVNVVAAHALEANPDISLDVFQHMTEVD
jgi:hypothetical protein